MDLYAKRPTSPPRCQPAIIFHQEPRVGSVVFLVSPWLDGFRLVEGHSGGEDHLEVSDEEFGALQAGNCAFLRGVGWKVEHFMKTHSGVSLLRGFCRSQFWGVLKKKSSKQHGDVTSVIGFHRLTGPLDMHEF